MAKTAKKHYKSAWLTGNWYPDGKKEIGNTCGHRHRTVKAALACKRFDPESADYYRRVCVVDQDGTIVKR